MSLGQRRRLAWVWLRSAASFVDKATGEVGRVGSVVSALFILGLMFLVTADVIGRYALSEPVPATLEVSESALVFVVFLAFAWSQRQSKNIRVEVAMGRFPPRARALADILSLTLGLTVFLLIVWQSGKTAMASWEVREYMTGLVKFPLYPSKLVVPLGAALLCVQYVVDICRSIVRLARVPSGEGEPRNP